MASLASTTDTHSSYEKMSDNTQAMDISKSLLLSSSNSWVATEKVHGANFAFVVMHNGEDMKQPVIRAAKRNGYISENDAFFGYSSMFSQNLPLISSCYMAIAQKFQQKNLNLEAECYERKLEKVIIYGELFGGVYNHPRLLKQNENNSSEDNSNGGEANEADEIEPVQAEIQYHPRLQFYAFDIALHFSAGPKTYLDYLLALEIFAQNHLFHAKPLMIGSLADCINFDINFPTRIPDFFDLPPINNNFAEGIVVKNLGGPGRFIFKRKAQQFQEKVAQFNSKNRYQSHQKTSKQERKTGKIVAILTEFITKNRLVNLCSKQGISLLSKGKKKKKIEEKTVKELQDLLLTDCVESACEESSDFASEYCGLNQVEQLAVHRSLSHTIAAFIQLHLQQ
jgi:Rnl2 family RNA ligase